MEAPGPRWGGMEMKKLKIGLWAKHAGLIDLLMEMWRDHDIRLAPRWDRFPPTWQGDEDIIVSTLPYDNPLTDKPIIYYYTDPTFPEIQQRIQKEKDAGKAIVIGAENCFRPEQFISGVTEFIPFALNPTRYPPYKGFRPAVSIVNKKPLARWDQVVRGATGVGMTLEEFLGWIPFQIIDEYDTNRFRMRGYAENRVLFYFSNSPYTIVMFEAMTVGMPIVAFNHHHWWANYKPIEKYLTHYSTDRDEIRAMLREFLTKDPQRVTYPNLPKFEEVQDLWTKLFERISSR